MSDIDVEIGKLSKHFIGSFAIGNEASAMEESTLASSQATWQVAENYFCLTIGKANMITKLEKHERKVLRRILCRMFGQMKAQEGLFDE